MWSPDASGNRLRAVPGGGAWNCCPSSLLGMLGPAPGWLGSGAPTAELRAKGPRSPPPTAREHCHWLGEDLPGLACAPLTSVCLRAGLLLLVCSTGRMTLGYLLSSLTSAPWRPFCERGTGFICISFRVCPAGLTARRWTFSSCQLLQDAAATFSCGLLPCPP